MMLVLAFIYTVCMSIKTLVLEKELRLKEVLRAVGIRNGALWVARLVENFALLMVPCALISVMVKVSGEASPEAGTQSIAVPPVCGISRPLVGRTQIARIASALFSGMFVKLF